MEDSFRAKGLRKKLVGVLKDKGISDPSILEAIGNIPRHFFMDSAFIEHAYQDKAFPIDSGQTISQPYTVAFQTQLLEVEKGHKVLEIGTGSGYQTMVLSILGARTYSIERHKTLHLLAKKILREIKGKALLFLGDGYKGLEQHAPFDRILITCGAPYIPKALIDQLKVGGIMVIPVGDQQQKMVKAIKQDDGSLKISEHGNFKFVPMLEKVEK